MKTLAVLFLTAVAANAYQISFPESTIEHTGHERIYGGANAKEGQFPFMALALFKHNGIVLRCSASLISSSKVLLAAHCVENLDVTNGLIIAGKANLAPYVKIRSNHDIKLWKEPLSDDLLDGVQERWVSKAFSHPEYICSQTTCQHDVAIVQLSQPFNLASNIQTLQISQDQLKPDTDCTILGWGQIKEGSASNQLQFAKGVHLKSTDDGCKYKDEGDFYCLYNVTAGICRGDSGSPLVCNNKIYGVASHQINLGDGKCGESLEEYYTDLSKDVQFLKENASNLLRASSIAIILTTFIMCL